jgi:hypothetical protein
MKQHLRRFDEEKRRAICEEVHKLMAAGFIKEVFRRGGRSGYPKISGRVIRVFKISGFENQYLKLQRVLQYPKIRVPEISGSGSGIPELPKLLYRLHKNTYTLLNLYKNIV